MKLVTKRLILRPGTKKDVKDVVEGINNLNVSRWLLVVPYPYKRKDALFWINICKKNKKKEHHYMIELKSEKKIIGGIGIQDIHKQCQSAQVGYWINEKYHGQGYGSEALNAVLKFAFEKLRFRRIEAAVFVGNPSSGKLLEKFGGVQEGLKRKSEVCKADGKIKDAYIYGILKEDWKNAVKKIEKSKK